MTETAEVQSDELAGLEILRAFKRHFAGDGTRNLSPFEEGLIVQYHTDVESWDVPEIHLPVRLAIQNHLRGLHDGKPAQVVILAGDPGIGKSHLLNHFQSPALCKDLDYILVCNSNHWKVEEFDECLLDWILDALVRPSPNEPHLLLDRIQDLAFQALSQILARPGYLKRFIRRKDVGLVRRMWDRLVGSNQTRFQEAPEKRDADIFMRLDFSRFSNFVCDQFLKDNGNPFHRYVLRVLLRYLYPEDREKTLHWLRRRKVHDHFLNKLGADEAIDRSYKIIDTIKILISLFSAEISRAFSSPHSRGKVFFFAFDQMEGRRDLFESENDWFKFFAQLSELYNTLPNVFILFTMTLGLRDKLYPKMERQFQHRIHRDQKFVLREIADEEVLAVYRRRIHHWLGAAEDIQEVCQQVADPRFQYLPFSQQEILGQIQGRGLREILETLDSRFRQFMLENITLTDPRFEYLVALNEIRRGEELANSFHYTEGHLQTVAQLLHRAGGFFGAEFGLTYSGLEVCQKDDAWPALRLEFRSLRHEENWARVFLVRMPFKYNSKIEGSINLLFKLQTDRNFLWLVRPEKVDGAWENERPNQIFARVLPRTCESNLQAMLRLLDKRDRFKHDAWKGAEQVLLEEFKLTYLGELFQHVAETLDNQMVSQDLTKSIVAE